MNNEITKALQGASQLLKGDKPTITAEQLEQAMFDLSELRKFAGEAAAASFSRLVAEGDSDIDLLGKALDAVRFAG